MLDVRQTGSGNALVYRQSGTGARDSVAQTGGQGLVVTKSGPAPIAVRQY